MARTKRPTAAQLAELDEMAGRYKAFKADEKKAKDNAAALSKDIADRMQAWGLFFLPLADWQITLKTENRAVDIDRARKVLKLGVLRKVLKTVVVMGVWDELKKQGQITDSDEAACIVMEPVSPHVYINPVKATSKKVA